MIGLLIPLINHVGTKLVSQVLMRINVHSGVEILLLCMLAN